jgi:hypothetical protein
LSLASNVRFALAAGLLALAAPAFAQPGDDSALLRTVRVVADATSGQRIGNGTVADKVVYFGRNTAGEIVVTSVAALAPGAPAAEAPAGAIALLRTRAATPGGNAAPDPADLALARATGIAVFIVGEWRSPPVVWELLRQSGEVRIRDVDAQGSAGAWRAPAG